MFFNAFILHCNILGYHVNLEEDGSLKVHDNGDNNVREEIMLKHSATRKISAIQSRVYTIDSGNIAQYVIEEFEKRLKCLDYFVNIIKNSSEGKKVFTDSKPLICLEDSAFDKFLSSISNKYYNNTNDSIMIITTAFLEKLPELNLSFRDDFIVVQEEKYLDIKCLILVYQETYVPFYIVDIEKGIKKFINNKDSAKKFWNAFEKATPEARNNFMTTSDDVVHDIFIP